MAVSPIRKLGYVLNAQPAYAQMLEHWDDIWDLHKLRTEQYVHSDVQDIWLRFHEWQDGLSLEEFNKPHESIWYPVAEVLTELTALAHHILLCKMRTVHPKQVSLGGVLVTRIPAGARVEPHVDNGWHAEHYTTKQALQIMGDEDQAFCFEGYKLSTLPGELFEFDNSQVHWVENNSEIDRITLIVCMRVEDV